MTTARVNDIDIWYERSGTPPAGDAITSIPVILHHGFAGPASTGWPTIVDRLKQRCDVVIYDARAHGETTVPDPATVTMPQYAADMAGLMDALGIRAAHIAGVSFGGMVAAQFACDFPERMQSLALFDTVACNGGSDDPAATQVEDLLATAFARLSHIVEKYGLQGLVDRENAHRHNGDKYAHLANDSLELQDERNRRNKVEGMTPAGFLAAARALSERPDLSARIPKITAPTLVSCGEWDLFYPCAIRDGKLIPNARFVTIKRASHDTLLYQPEAWFETFRSFLSEQR